jgi:hypothetical protein
MPYLPFKKILLTLVVAILLTSCAKGPSEEDLNYLTGYWEISRVVFPDGTEKRYEINSTIEFLSWDGNQGYRKKVQPTLDGTYLTSDDAVSMEVVWREKALFLSFPEGEDPWKEEVLELSQSELVTRHANGLRYEYKRYEPLTNTKTRA